MAMMLSITIITKDNNAGNNNVNNISDNCNDNDHKNDNYNDNDNTNDNNLITISTRQRQLFYHNPLELF